MTETAGLTFEQREGLTELPTQLALGEINQAVKARLWDAVVGILEANKERRTSGWYATEYLEIIARRHFIEVRHGYADEFSSSIENIKKSWKPYFFEDATYGKTLGFTEWLVQADRGQTSIGSSVRRILMETRCSYRLVEDNTIVPVASEEEAAAFLQALQTLQNAEQLGARKHLLLAASQVSQAHFADSVRESINSVEALLRNLTGQSKFSSAISQIAADRNLHGSFKQALLNLYGYSSDEQGIRHPLLDKGDANVTEQDALFMLGVCAAFVTYLAPGVA